MMEDRLTLWEEDGFNGEPVSDSSSGSSSRKSKKDKKNKGRSARKSKDKDQKDKDKKKQSSHRKVRKVNFEKMSSKCTSWKKVPVGECITKFESACFMG